MWEIPDIVSFAPSEMERLKPNIENEEEKKKLFGIELGKGLNPFEAACNVVGNGTSQALYISQRWLNDPAVIAAKDLYFKAVYNSNELLDADQLAARLLQMSEEKDRNNNFYTLEGKDRLKALDLYAEIKGFKGKNNQPTNNFLSNTMIVKFVAPEKKEKIVEQLPNEQSVNNKSPLKLKLVS